MMVPIDSLFQNREISSATFKLSDNKEPEILISFRDAFKFPNTNYGLFGLYKYPAKFIPHVVLYIISKYSRDGDLIFDPFAGQGTVGFACWLYGRNYILWDLNPLLDFLHNFVSINPIKFSDVTKIVNCLFQDKGRLYPNWENLKYWYPETILELLGVAWNNIRSIEHNDLRYIFTLAFLKISKFFSFADEKVHKLYRSKRAMEKIDFILQSNVKEAIVKKLIEEVVKINERLIEWKKLNLKKPKYFHVIAGIDTYTENLEKEVDILITSPPYLQAQEYIRSTKMELYWLGFSDLEIKRLSRLEIPYRSYETDFRIQSKTYEYYLEEIQDVKLARLYKNYFNFVINILERLSYKVRKYMCIFVGPVKVEQKPIPIDQIIKEHFTAIGWKHEVTYIDKVRNRVMFKTKSGLNPSSGKIDSRMDTEHMVVLKRNEIT